MAITSQGAPNTYSNRQECPPQAVPTSPTDITTSSCKLIGLWVHNPTGGSSRTLTFKDKQDTPAALPFDGVAIAAGTDLSFNAPWGIPANGGMTISADGAGLVFSLTYTS